MMQIMYKKFKVGDTVKITSSDMVSRDWISHIGELHKIIKLEDGAYILDGISDGCRWWERHELEFVKLNKEIIKPSSNSRKDMPVFSGVLKYFPLALLELSKVSKAGNDQHNPDKPMFWDRGKSGDEQDALTRHLIDDARDPGGRDTDGILHKAKVAWRALAALQKELEIIK